MAFEDWNLSEEALEDNLKEKVGIIQKLGSISYLIDVLEREITRAVGEDRDTSSAVTLATIGALSDVVRKELAQVSVEILQPAW